MAVVVLVAVAAVFALMGIAGIGGNGAATTAPEVTTVILQDTITPTESGAPGGTTSTMAGAAGTTSTHAGAGAPSSQPLVTTGTTSTTAQ